MVVLGQFTGGAFRYNDKFLDLKDKVICFDGSLEHASETFEGHRVSIIWFLHSSAAHPSPMELDSLVALGLMDSTAVVPEWIVEDPWDLLYKLPRNVLANKQAVRSAAANSKWQHWALNCSTFTRAREWPIENAKWSPPPLRSERFPQGTPHRRSNKHPANSLAFHLPSWKELCSLPGVMVLRFHSCMLEGGEHKKWQALVTNFPRLSLSLPRTCMGTTRCSRTELPHSSMAPVVENGVVIHYGMHDACQYPNGFCRNLARQFLSHRNGNFVEFFSGPKAPLTESVKALMVERRAASLLTVFEAPTPVLQQAVQVVAEQEPLGERLMTSGRLHQKQRKWSSDHQLIPDGLTSPLHHLAMAKRLKYPLRTWDDLPAGLLQAVNFVVA
jgi:hypothetical protein